MHNSQTANKHHYVPQWYQRRFLPKGKGEFFVLDKTPIRSILCGDGQVRALQKPKRIRQSGTNELFQEENFYSLSFPLVTKDILEKTLFGTLDDLGSIGNAMLLEWPTTTPHPDSDCYPFQFGDPNKQILNLIKFIDAQKSRTPRGIDSLKTKLSQYGYSDIDNNLAMSLFIKRRHDNCTVWLESLWEIFSTPSLEHRFLLSDEPVLFYNMDCFPASKECSYPFEPHPFWRGTRVIYPLSPYKLLLLSHKEHVDQPSRLKAKRMRQNARIYGDTIFGFTEIENSRTLTADEVLAINHAIKIRATRFVASPIQDDLFPEDSLKPIRWSSLDDIFHSEYKTYHTDSTIHLGYSDGREESFNAFGEEIPAKANKIKKEIEDIINRERIKGQ